MNQGANLDDVFDWVNETKEGFTKVELGNKCSFIDANNQLIGGGKIWFDYAYDFNNGIAKVIINGIIECIDTSGNVCTLQDIINKGAKLTSVFDLIGDTSDGFTKVILFGKYSFIDANNQLIGGGKLWFNDAKNFNSGIAKVLSNNKYCYIDTKGNFYNKKEAFNIIGKNVQQRLNQGVKPKDIFDGINNFYRKFIIVKLSGMYSIMDKDNQLINHGEMWFDNVYGIKNGFIEVLLNGKIQYVDSDGKIYSKEDVLNINIQTAKEQLSQGASPKNVFNYVGNFSEGFAWVELNGMYSFINTNNQLIGNGNLWFDGGVGHFNHGFANVKLKGNYYLMDTNLNFYDIDTKQPIPNPFNKTNESKQYRKIHLTESQFSNIVNIFK